VASVRSFRQSRYWYACFSIRTAEGKLKQVQRNTKETSRKRALEIARKWESAAHKRLTEAEARKVIGEIYALVNPGDALAGSTSHDWFTSWASNKSLETSTATAARYKRVCAQFVASLEKRADLEVSAISIRDVLKFRDGIAARLSSSTANTAVKIVRMALKDAVGAGLCLTNIAATIKPAKSQEAENSGRRAFTLAELQRIFREAQDEWRGLILFGLYTGQRLGDVAALTWRNLDLARGEIALVSRKTNRRILIPLADPLRGYLESLSAGDDPDEPIFPKAHARRTGTLSNQFYEILAATGLAEKRRHRSQGKGREGRRRFNQLSFHALRHTATSWMKNAGISPAIVQDIIGHDSPAISAHYTHIEESAKRRAIESLPDLTR
jgi:integrase